MCVLVYTIYFTAVFFPVIGCLNSSMENALNWLIPSYHILCLPHSPVAGSPVRISGVRKSCGFEGPVVSRVHCEAEVDCDKVIVLPPELKLSMWTTPSKCVSF